MFTTLNERKKLLEKKKQQKLQWKDQLLAHDVELKKLQQEDDHLENEITKRTNKLYKLKRRSLVYFLTAITRSVDKKIVEKEDQLASIEEKRKNVKQEISEIRSEMKNIQEKVNELPNIEEETALIFNKQIEIIGRIDSPLSREYIDKEKQITRLENFLQKSVKSMEIGKEAKEHYIETRALLKRAARWGGIDMLGGRGYSGHKKHQYINEANDYILAAQSKKKLLEEGILHMKQENNVDFQMHESLVFADFVFDGIFIDYIIQEKIEEAINKVDIQMIEVDRVMNHLDFRYKMKEKELLGLIENRNELFVKIESMYSHAQ